MNEPDPDTVTIAHVSDLHAGRLSEQAAATLVADVTAHRPDVTVVTGDLTMRARHHEFASARDLLERLPAPRLIILGNHDVPLYNLARRLTNPYRAYQHAITPTLDPRLDLPGARILGLQSMPRWRWKSGRISPRQCDRIAAELGSPPRGALRIVAMHHPLTQHGLERSAGLALLRRRLADASVDLVLAGHTHVPSVTVMHLQGERQAHDVVEVVAGTAGGGRTRGVPASWTCITASHDSLRIVTRHRAEDLWIDADVVCLPRRTWS